MDFVFCKRSTRFPPSPAEVLARTSPNQSGAPTTASTTNYVGGGREWQQQPADASTSPREGRAGKGSANKGNRQARKCARREAEAKSAAARAAALQAQLLLIQVQGVLYWNGSRAGQVATNVAFGLDARRCHVY